MDQFIKNSIDSRRNSIFTVYNVYDEKLLKEIDDLFKKMEELGSKCSNVMDFETKLASSSLNQEYIDLFAKIAQSSNPVLNDEDTIASDLKIKSYEEEKNIERPIKEITRPVRRIAREEAEKKLRSTPVIGDIMGVKQHIDLIGGIKRKKDAKKEQKKLQEELEKEKSE